jgi:HAD superfamily hydrolase (TIGR01549 family)
MSSASTCVYWRRQVSLTLLLDLDDTLLQNNIDSFLPHYLDAFSKEAADYVDPDRFVQMLLAGTQQMVKNRRPDCTLREVFDAAFFPALGVNPGKFQSLADDFYSRIFPKLHDLTSSRPEAVELVETAKTRGYRVVIATNPLFPMTAILQRLEWAKLPIERYEFDLITSYETFHFVKPEPSYYAEIMARLGWPSGEVLSVGDDLGRDITASRRLGLPAFWLTRDGVPFPDNQDAPTSSGNLADVLPWLDNTPAEKLKPDYTSPSAMLAILRSTPAALDSLCRHLSEWSWKTRPQPDEWCITEILCHLRDVDQGVNMPRVRKVLENDNPFLPGEDTDRWAEERKYFLQDGLEALKQFTAIRLKLLDILEAILADSWKRSARHAIFGPTDLAELVGIVAGHDRLHIQQVHQVLSTITKTGG